jgi:hypothetical protein
MKREPAKPALAEVSERAKKERDSILAAAPVVATAAGAVGGVSAAQSQAPAQTAARDARSDIVARRPVPPAVQRAAGASNFAQVPAPALDGCYQVADSANWPRPLPRRFSLLADSAGSVRASGDSVVGNWARTSPTTALVQLHSRVTFTVERRAEGYVAVLRQSSLAALTRLDCPR